MTVSRRACHVVFFTAFALVLAYAAIQRFSLPLTPIFDPDSPGYIRPALLQLAGEGFQQTHGRAFLYPTMALGVLSVTGDLRAIVVLQHLASLLSGVAWLAAWLVWVSMLPRGFLRDDAAPVAGLACVALYLWSSETILFGPQIRPEAVFPLFAALQILCLLAYLKVRWPADREQCFPACLGWGAAAMYFAVAAANLKPSWGFAVLLSPLVLVIGVVVRRGGKSLALCAAPLFVGVLLVLLFNAVLPAVTGWKTDRAAGRFLPTLLFAVHADILAESLEQDVRLGKATPEEAAFLGRLRGELEESRRRKGTYRLLGFNPDYLMFQSKALANLPGVSTLPQLRSYCFGNYLRALGRQPGRFANKWFLQIRSVVCPNPKFLSRSSCNFLKLYEDSLHNLPSRGNLPDGKLAVSLLSLPPATEALTARLTHRTETGPGWLREAAEAGALLYLPSLILCLLAPVFGLFWFREHYVLFCGAWIVAAAGLSSALTVAIIHSFDIDRYASLQGWITWLTVACGFVLGLWLLRQMLPLRQAEEKP